jgi:hypothetical protein
MPCYKPDGTAQWTTPTITRTANHILTIGPTDGEALPEFVDVATGPFPPVVAGPFPPVAAGPFTDCESN